ncbi:ABC1 kinase family protein [Peptostreptococcus anaerobius]|uniref:ABC1 family protein n=1 Tax=Peptostreptococcus anaerobius TaxID=1261 RepID=A0A135YZI6_9FIRM|nr:AarF/UbiB family protein [Peptostreptococcus anaerobius]KXI14824.1 ABC1 family protein [Peptostreptococcus anaerobius]MCB6982086.1 AarF/ABC1/UbiB kinase family protein [Peptostreptococcus anaerobius]MCQ5149917.1 AarF/UbiB family protein [Peptostreptococcus anaerobius]MDU5095856.1 AarF/UbiB family protein [Peptostreptococcus anaerobius]CCY50446.1 aBC-1 domain protein [Peptostreptococcus anaerobius CAG:621]
MRVSYKYLGRYREIATVLIKYGFGFIVDKLNKESVAGNVTTHGPGSSVKKMTTGQRLRFAFEELGPTYIKIGQIISTRKDLFDDDIISELSKLRDDVEQFDDYIAMDLLDKELGVNRKEVFSYISESPIAAASIGQVYSARLKDGTDVVIKIQRPNIESTIKADIEILKRLSSNLEFLKKEWNVDIYDLISEMEMQLVRELDYKFEEVNGTKLRNIFKDSKEVFIPRIYDEYTTKRLLVMEKVNGLCLSDISSHKLSDDKKKKIVDIGVRSFFRQVMTCGFFHADPHPGNIFVMDDMRLAYIDFGMVGLIDDKTLGQLNQLILAATDKNVDKIIRILADMDAISKSSNDEGLKRDLLYLVHYYFDIPFDRLRISEVLDEAFRFMRNHRVSLPSQLVILGKTMITLEGTSRGLYKEFSAETIASSYIRYYKHEKLDIRRNINNLKSGFDEYYFDLVSVPGQLKNIISILEKNELKLDIGEMRSPKIEENIRKFTTQVSMAIMLTACIVGSSLILASENIQKSRTIKFVGICGFILSFIIGLALVFLIFKNNYHRKD